MRNLLPAAVAVASVENEENDPPTQQRRGRLTTKGSTNVLRKTYRFPHSNSPHEGKRMSRSVGSGRKPEGKAHRHIRWKDENVSPALLARKLEKQGLVAVAALDQAQNGGARSGLLPRHRTGLQRRMFTPDQSDVNDSGIERVGSFSPDRTACRRIIHSRSISVKPSLFFTKRRMMVMSIAVGLASLVYFVEVKQLMKATSLARYGQGASREWLMSFPRSFSSSIRGKQKDYFNYSGGIARVEEPYFSESVSVRSELMRVRSLSKSRVERRRSRTRPPSTNPSTLSIALPSLMVDLPFHREIDTHLADSRALQVTNEAANNRSSIRRRLPPKETSKESPPICGSHAKEASQLNPHHYPPSAHIGPKSRIVITGALSQVGMELILQLHEQCNVKFVVGIDSAYPNTRHERIDLIESRYKYVQRRVPGFQRLIVPVFGIHPHPKVGEERRLEEMGNGFDLVRRLNPTHIVHLAGLEEGRGEHIDFGDTTGASPFTKGGKRGMMRRFDSLLSTDQVLLSLARFEKHSKGKEQPQLVYLSSNEANDQSGVPMKSDAASPFPATVYGTSCLLKEVLASYYHRNHGVDSVGLRVPAIFGPFSRPGSLFHDLAERTMRNAAGRNIEGVPKYHLDRDRYELSNLWKKRDGANSGAKEQWAYVYDVASAIVAAMQFKKDYSSSSIDSNGPTLMRIGSKLTASMNDLKEKMEEYLPSAYNWDAQISPSYQREIDGLKTDLNDPRLSIYDSERNRDLLGWTHKTKLHEGIKSALAWQVLKAYPFGLPKSVPGYSTFQSLLDNSRSKISYHSLPCASGCRWGSRGGGMCSPSPWDSVLETTVEITETCPFVLYTVDLRPELVSLEKHSAPSQRKGWEDWFCKIAFVSSSSKLVKKVYGNELRENTPLKDWNGNRKDGHWIIVALQGTQYNLPEFERSLAKMTPTTLFNERVEKAMFVDHRRVILTTDQAMGVMSHLEMKKPRRHSIFFTNKYSFKDDYDTSSAQNLAQFVMSNAGIPETKDIRAQMQFYEQTAHLTRTNMQRSPNYQELNKDNHFPFAFLRSSWIVHELKSQEGRHLRCEMYEEHAMWGNQDMEDMSMGYVLARRRVKMQLGQRSDAKHSGPEEWFALLIPRDLDQEDATNAGPVYLDYLEPLQSVVKDSMGHELFITFLPQKK